MPKTTYTETGLKDGVWASDGDPYVYYVNGNDPSGKRIGFMPKEAYFSLNGSESKWEEAPNGTPAFDAIVSMLRSGKYLTAGGSLARDAGYPYGRLSPVRGDVPTRTVTTK